MLRSLGLEFVVLWAALIVLVAAAILPRLVARPPLSARYPLTFWLIDFVVAPLSVLTVLELISRTAIGMGLTGTDATLDTLTVGLLLLLGVWLSVRLLDIVVWPGVFVDGTDQQTPALVKGLAYGLLLAAALALFLWWIDYPVTGVLVSTGVIAGIIGLALQNTLSDLFSGIALNLDRPFRMGEWIELDDGTVGQLVDMTWRSTRLKTFNNTITTIPNSKLASLHVTNLDRPTPAYSDWYYIKLSPEVDPRLAVTLLSTAVGRCRHVLTRPAPAVRLSDAQVSPYTYMVWVHYRNYLAHFKAREELFREVNAVLRDAHIRPAAPFQEIKIERNRPVQPVAPEIAHALRSFELFQGLSDPEIQQIAAGSHYSMIDTGTEIMREGAEIKSVTFLVSGLLRSTVTLPNGRSVDLVDLTPGESAGWSELVLGEKAIGTFTAAVDSLVVEVDEACLRPVLSANPELRERLAEIVRERIRRADGARAAMPSGRSGTRTSEEILRRIEQFLSRTRR